MVGRLVQQQQVGIEKQQLGQFRTHQPAAAEFGDRTCQIAVSEAEATEHYLRLVFEVVAASGLELMLERAKLLEQDFHLLRLWRRPVPRAAAPDGAQVRSPRCAVEHVLRAGVCGNMGLSPARGSRWCLPSAR